MANEITLFAKKVTGPFVRKFKRGNFEDLDWDAEKQYAISILSKNDYLRTCSPESFAIAMLDVAYTGLSLSPSLGHAYLIPYKGELQFKPSYKGMEHLVYRAGTVQSIQSALVRSRDSFQVQTVNNRRTIHHVEHSAPEDPVIAAYAILHYTNGGEYVEVMNISELRAVEAQAKSVPGGGKAYKGPWIGEMYRKAVLRRALKHTPLDLGGKLEQAIAIADKYEPMDFGKPTEPDKPEPGTSEVLVSQEQGLEIHAALTEGGLTSTQANGWMEKLAEAMGYAKFDDLPASRFEEAKARAVERLHKWQQARPA